MAGYTIAERPVILDSNGNVAGFRNPDGTVTYIPTSTEPLSGLTSSAAELNKLDGAPFVMTTVSTTPASGSCAAQFALKDAASAALTAKVAVQIYLSDVNGAIVAAQTSLAALTNGTLAQTTTGQVAIVSTTATGLFGVTLTAAAGTYYLTAVLPNGALAVSGALVVN